MSTIKKTLNILLICLMLFSTISVNTLADETLTPLAEWDMSEVVSANGSYYIKDMTGGNNSLRAYFGDGFKNEYAVNPLYSSQKTAHVATGPYWPEKYNPDNGTYDMIAGSADIVKALDSKYTFETWLKLTRTSGDSAIFMVWDSDEKFWNTSLSLYMVNGKGNLIIRRMYQAGQKYYETSASLEVGVWNHIVLSYDCTSSSNDPILVINGQKIAVRDVIGTASGSPKTSAEGKGILEIARYYESGYLPLCDAYYGRTAVYGTNMTLEQAVGNYNAQKDLYSNGFVINGTNEGDTIDSLKSGAILKEGELVLSADLGLAGVTGVKDSDIVIADANGDEIKLTTSQVNGVYSMKTDFIEEGEYTITAKKDILDKEGKPFRTSDQVITFTVSRNDIFRARITDEVKAIFENDGLSNEEVKNKILADYNGILKFDVSETSDYGKIVDKNSFFGILRNIVINDFDGIREAFEIAVNEQKNRDIIVAVEAYNKAVETSDSVAIKDVIFTKYESVFKLDLTLYNVLKNPDNAIAILYNDKVSSYTDVVNKFNKAVEKVFRAEREEEFLTGLKSETPENLTSYMTKYSDIIDIDINNKDYLECKDEVNKAIKENNITNVSQIADIFYCETLLNSLNNLEKGEREEIRRLLTEYQNYWTVPSNYKKADNSTISKLIAKLDGKNYKNVSDIGKIVEDIISDIEDEEQVSSRPSSGNSGNGGYSSSDSTKVNDYSVSGIVSSTVIKPTPAPERTPFTDIDGVLWAKASIIYLYENNIINGKSETTFAPLDFVTRAEVAKIFCEAFGFVNVNGILEFNDVNKEAWYYNYVLALYNAGILNGLSETTYGVNDNLKRCDLAVILNRIAMQKEMIPEEVTSEKYADDNLIPDYAKEAVYNMRAIGILNGIGGNNFDADSPLTRAALSKAVYSFITYKK